MNRLTLAAKQKLNALGWIAGYYIITCNMCRRSFSGSPKADRCFACAQDHAEILAALADQPKEPS